MSNNIIKPRRKNVAPMTRPVTTSHTPPFKSNNIRKLSSFDEGFSNNSWLISGNTEYAVSDVIGWACVKTTVSAERNNLNVIRFDIWKHRTGDNHIRSIVRKFLLQRGIRSRHDETAKRLTTNFSYTWIALWVAVATGYSWTSGNSLISRSSLNVDGTISGAIP